MAKKLGRRGGSGRDGRPASTGRARGPVAAAPVVPLADSQHASLEQAVEALRESERQLAESEERFRLLAENAQDLVFRYRLQPDAGFDYVSPASSRITGYTPAEYYADPELPVRTVHPDDLEALTAALDPSGISTRPQTLRVIRKDGEVVWVEQRVVPIHDETGELVAIEGIARDISERKRVEEQLAHQALHDPLTELPNRMLFMDRLDQAMARLERREHTTLAVLFLDLDQFKLINDTLSHQAGDDVLVEVGRRLRDTLRPGDTVARFGGDEFAVLCEDVADVHQVVTIADRIGEAIKQPLVTLGREVAVTASIGVAMGFDARATPDSLLRDADAAMYRAKERGRDRCELFDEAMRARAFQRLNIEQGLRGAIERGELRLVYQPIFDVATGHAVAVEALVRWEHPERGQVLPSEFVPLAEESGLIVPIGTFVLGEACRQAAAWRRAHAGPPVVVSVNLSARQLGVPDLPQVVSDALVAAGLEPGGLCLEITESAVMDDAQSAAESLRALRQLGVSLAIDDFGTGYSSLGYLKRFPIDTLKVDRAFVDGLGEDPEDSAIVAAVVSLGHALGVRVAAEGVETPEQLAELRRLGCDEAQGYYFARPVPAATLEELVWG